MTELLETAKIWFLGLGDQYGVNPIVFGSIYVGAIPFFTLSVAWLMRNYRYDKSIILPALAATFFFVSAYLYLIIEGENVPWWVYGIVVLMVAYGSWSTLRSIRRKVKKIEKEIISDE
jgi:ABC-type Co2+ transport system permease subunit